MRKGMDRLEAFEKVLKDSITLSLICHDPLREHFTLLIAEGHEHSFPVLKIQIHLFPDGQIDRCSNLAKEEMPQNSLFRMNP